MVKSIIVLAMHGAPPLDFPRAELSEFFNLHGRIEHAPEAQREGMLVRWQALDRKIRDWPRTPQNDPFFMGASALAAALARAAGCEVMLGFNEFCAPDLGDALELAVQAGADRVVVVTAMMTRGGEHSEVEIPAAVRAAQQRHPEIVFHYAWPLELDAVAGFLSSQVARYLA